MKTDDSIQAIPPESAEPQLGTNGDTSPGSAKPQLGTNGVASPGSAKPQLGTNGVASPGSAEPQLGSNLHQGWYSRGYLPHHDESGLVQVITYRLADSLSKTALNRIEMELAALPAEQQDIEMHKRLDHWLDAGHGNCILRQPDAAQCVVETWRRFHGDRYDLIAWVVMPNHMHVLIRVFPEAALGKIVQSWKSYTGRKIREIQRREEECRAGARRSQDETCRAGARRSQDERSVWQREYWDRTIRDEKHFNAVIEYIHTNPVKVGLVAQAADWPWSSAKEYKLGRTSSRSTELGLGAPGKSQSAELGLGAPR